MQRCVSALLLLCAPLGSLHADWKPARGPLPTRWTGEVSPEKVLPEYPRPQMVREQWLNLNGLWQMAERSKDEPPPFGKELGEQILVPFPIESALSGVMKRAERLWYRRTFEVPARWSGKKALLHFGAVDWETIVWVNGKEMGRHEGGYDSFTFDVTPGLKPSGSQEIIVGVWDPTDAGTQPRGKQVRRPEGIYYTPTTGIWQTVWLEPVPELHIERVQILPDFDNSKVHIGAVVAGAKPTDHLAITVLDGAQSIAAEKASLESKGDAEITIPNPKSWSPQSPFLYGLRVELQRQGKKVDTVQSYFGLRKISIGKDEKGTTRILLNNQFVFQIGLLDQGFWPDGLYTAPTDAALKYDIETTLKLGFNLARKHVKVEPERWYYWCDKLGLLVWQDMPSGDRGVGPGKGEIQRTPESARQYERELQSMIEGRRNHPCIIMWVVFNEGWGQFDTPRITRLAEKLDASRLVDCASGWNDFRVGDVHDFHLYPGPGGPPPEVNRAAVLGEFGGLGLAVDGHTWTKKTWGYRGTKDREDLTRKYEKLLEAVWKLKKEKGLSAAVYTQTTDVETEANGLMTYDREVIKMDADRVRAANQGDFTHVPR
jgi:beta-galactosidase/beta-glucuronidase